VAFLTDADVQMRPVVIFRAVHSDADRRQLSNEPVTTASMCFGDPPRQGADTFPPLQRKIASCAALGGAFSISLLCSSHLMVGRSKGPGSCMRPSSLKGPNLMRTSPVVRCLLERPQPAWISARKPEEHDQPRQKAAKSTKVCKSESPRFPKRTLYKSVFSIAGSTMAHPRRDDA
jgi:hypothetical protein